MPEILGMQLAYFLGLMLTLVGGIALFVVATGIKTVGQKNKNGAIWGSVAVGAIGFVLLLNIGGAGVALNTLTAGGTSEPQKETGQASCPSGLSRDATGNCVAVPSPTLKKNQLIDTLSVKMQEKHSNAWNTVGNTANGSFVLYPSGSNPKDSNAKSVKNITVQAGEGSVSDSKLVTDLLYRMVFDGDGQWNDVDFGEQTFKASDYQAQIAGYLFLSGEGAAISERQKQVSLIATISDLISEASTDGDVNGETSTADTNAKVIARELINVTAASSNANQFLYNETNGDETFRIDLDIAFSGANSESERPALCFTWDQTNPPEGTEVKKITVSHMSGDTYSIPADITNYWSNEDCVQLADAATGGMLGTYRFTYTVDEATLNNGGDMWFMTLDDLGDEDGRSILNQKGASKVNVRFESAAS